MTKVDLKIDWATYAAAKYACEHWHYSKTVPVGKRIMIGVYEKNKFVGVVIFAWGMNNKLVQPYGLKMIEGCELARVALSKHTTPVSRIVAISIRFLKKHCPNIRIIVSFADPTEGHHGGIYQAGGWIYSGKTPQSFEWVLNGKRLHKRNYTGKGFRKNKTPIPHFAVKRQTQGKHRYLYPLDAAMREQILPLAKPYPKRAGSIENDAPVLQRDEGGVIPTPALHESESVAL